MNDQAALEKYSDGVDMALVYGVNQPLQNEAGIMEFPGTVLAVGTSAYIVKTQSLRSFFEGLYRGKSG